MSKINREEVTILLPLGNWLVYKGVNLKVTPEFIQDAQAHSITEDQIDEHILYLYNKKIAQIRDIKINQILEK